MISNQKKTVKQIHAGISFDDRAYEKIYELKNQKSLTFLYRAPRIDLRPLNIGTIAENYRQNFNLLYLVCLLFKKSRS